jgi:uncharacterized membrane protein YoaK (UPF0700 family)
VSDGLSFFQKFITTIDQNASVLVASFVGGIVSVVAREEKSLWSAVASFACGVFAGWYMSQIISAYVPIPREPLAAVMAIIGRDIVRHIISMAKNNPLFMFDILDRLRGRNNTSENSDGSH